MCKLCGRTVGPGKECKACIPKIYDEDRAIPLFDAAFDWLSQRGVRFSIPRDEIHFSLIRELIPAHYKVQEAELTFGLTHIQGVPNGPLRNAVVNVTLLRGLTQLHLIGYSLHELGHVWLFDNGLQHLPAPEVEGFCEYLRYQYYADTKTEEGSLQMLRMRRNENPVTGGGMRVYLDKFPAGALPKVLEHMVRNVGRA
jgi:hypothetical protein